MRLFSISVSSLVIVVAGPISASTFRDDLPASLPACNSLLDVNGRKDIVHEEDDDVLDSFTSVILPSPIVEGLDRSVQQWVAAELMRWEAFGIPKHRAAWFSWCLQEDNKIAGWDGTIIEFTHTPTGWIAKVRVVPRIVSEKGSRGSTADYLVEVYEMSHNEIRIIGVLLPDSDLSGIVEFY